MDLVIILAYCFIICVVVTLGLYYYCYCSINKTHNLRRNCSWESFLENFNPRAHDREELRLFVPDDILEVQKKYAKLPLEWMTKSNDRKVSGQRGLFDRKAGYSTYRYNAGTQEFDRNKDHKSREHKHLTEARVSCIDAPSFDRCAKEVGVDKLVRILIEDYRQLRSYSTYAFAFFLALSAKSITMAHLPIDKQTGDYNIMVAKRDTPKKSCVIKMNAFMQDGCGLTFDIGYLNLDLETHVGSQVKDHSLISNVQQEIQ